jgi:hypothetical protein
MTFYEAFCDELEKISAKRERRPTTMEQVMSELRDPRLYSNVRGMLTLESRKRRVRAHKKLKKGKHSILGAARAGFLRSKD